VTGEQRSAPGASLSPIRSRARPRDGTAPRVEVPAEPAGWPRLGADRHRRLRPPGPVESWRPGTRSSSATTRSVHRSRSSCPARSPTRRRGPVAALAGCSAPTIVARSVPRRRRTPTLARCSALTASTVERPWSRLGAARGRSRWPGRWTRRRSSDGGRGWPTAARRPHRCSDSAPRCRPTPCSRPTLRSARARGAQTGQRQRREPRPSRRGGPRSHSMRAAGARDATRRRAWRWRDARSPLPRWRPMLGSPSPPYRPRRGPG
jgi:hypothetical protein